MPRVTFVNEHRTVEAAPGRLLSEIAAEVGIAVCRETFRGTGIGDYTCWVKGEPGATSPPTFLERLLGAKGQRRMANRTRVLGDVQVWTQAGPGNRLRAPRPIAPPPSPATDPEAARKPIDASGSAAFPYGDPRAVGQGKREPIAAGALEAKAAKEKKAKAAGAAAKAAEAAGAETAAAPEPAAKTPKAAAKVPRAAAAAVEGAATAQAPPTPAAETASTAPAPPTPAAETASTAQVPPTPAPEAATVAPKTASTAPQTDSTAPQTDSTAPQTDSTAPQTTSTAPPLPTPAPETATAAAETATATPKIALIATEIATGPPEAKAEANAPGPAATAKEREGGASE
ncbi:hypothetical protein WME99_35790 [Sorangium sp. So ce136]|uniref:hypothetical protein n=1 Tax=Sorangium sp. So ce136 TaxID=3133284 RepID=UPI003F07463A